MSRTRFFLSQVRPAKGCLFLRHGNSKSAAFIPFFKFAFGMLISLHDISDGLVTLHRADFLDCLASNLPREQASVHFGKRLVSYSESANSEMPITMEFKDGTTATCHVLLGADGVHSPTRHALLEFAARKAEAEQDKQETAARLREKIDPVWSGIISYRMVVGADKLRALNPNHSALTKCLLVSAEFPVFRLWHSRIISITESDG